MYLAPIGNSDIVISSPLARVASYSPFSMVTSKSSTLIKVKGLSSISVNVILKPNPSIASLESPSTVFPMVRVPDGLYSFMNFIIFTSSISKVFV